MSDGPSPKVLILSGLGVAAVSAWYVYNKNSKATADNAAQSQTPAADAALNYSVPPNIGVQTDNTGGLNGNGAVNGNAQVTLTNGAAQALPMG